MGTHARDRVDYDGVIHRAYDKGRKLAPDAVTLWMDVVSGFLSKTAGLTLLDVGSGTGRFSVPLGERFDAMVVGIEPSEKMRAEAKQKNSHPRVLYVGGCGEAIPFTAARFDVVFLSMVLHHLRSLRDTCAEIARVVRPAGLVFVRNDFKDSLPARYHDFFPRARDIGMARAPGIEETVAAFEEAGLRLREHRVVTQVLDDSLRSHCERIKLRALSPLQLLTDEEFEEGIQAMEAAAEAEVEPKPILDPIDVLVFDKPRESVGLDIPVA